MATVGASEFSKYLVVQWKKVKFDGLWAHFDTLTTTTVQTNFHKNSLKKFRQIKKKASTFVSLKQTINH